jgi:nucleotide-binding universal stress UspA family protein
MSDIVVVCTDGSDLADRAAHAGLARLHEGAEVIVVSVVAENDPTLVLGAGMAGGTETPEEYERLNAARHAEGIAAVERLAGGMSVKSVRREVLVGDAGAAVCDYAAEVGAAVIVLGTRGRGGFKRALLGSVSDYVVRNAPCSVLVTNANADSE